MQPGDFLEELRTACNKNNHFFVANFVAQLEEIQSSKEVTPLLLMTKMTILFEGFYRSLTNSCDLKTTLLQIRLTRWKNHFGTPTVLFLLTYKMQIDQTCDYFKYADQSLLLPSAPWHIEQLQEWETDEVNNVFINRNVSFDVPMPQLEEKTGSFIKTHNPSGGFATTPCDLFSQQFIEYAKNTAGNVLEIGAAFGAASLEALANGATVFCNDIQPENLAIVRNRYLRNYPENNSKTGDAKKLILIPGSFPEELTALPKKFFDAILICRVLHFFPGDLIEKSFQHMATLLKPGGKLFVICETPFLKNWQRFIPEYKKRVSENIEWPGEITNPAEFETSGRAATLPHFVHWITQEVIERSLKRTGFFELEHSSYIDRKGQFPDDLLLNGQESVGAIVVKK